MNQKKKNKQELRIWPDIDLTRCTEPVTNFGTTELNQNIVSLFQTLKEFQGLGLSACQIGDNRSYFVFKVKDREGVMINPKIIEDSGTAKHTSSEGCLSFPGVYIATERFNYVTVQFQDEEGIQHEEELIGPLGDCIQHEMDHLNGKTILEFLSRLKKDIVTRKMKKLQKRLTQTKEVNEDATRRALRGPSQPMARA